ncbi:hypothetical protein PAHAL_2G166100 [Panicum hallii]|jgi:hypothetical protein|uniref:Uncharacterized protein n=1 Tax=Panicum hallii TaxID=206008 RepID=A0A2T8KPE4_9POAL|nr:hypothetical protein PAHAL_2G166100 [Panicum hallii]
MEQVESSHDLPTTATKVLPLCCTTICDYYKALIRKYKLSQPARTKIKGKENMVKEDSNGNLTTTSTRVLPLCCTIICDFYEALIYKY